MSTAINNNNPNPPDRTTPPPLRPPLRVPAGMMKGRPQPLQLRWLVRPPLPRFTEKVG